MALKAVLDSIDEAPESVKSEYVQKEDGKFYLSVEGGEDFSGLKAHNQRLLDEKKKLQEKFKAFENIDPVKAKEALSKLQDIEDQQRKVEEKQLLDAGQVEEVVERRVNLMRRDHETQVAKLTEVQEGLLKENKTLKERLNKAVVERGILDAVNAVGQPRNEALIDIVSRGSRTWQLDDQGNPVPLNPDGTTIYGKDGKQAMTMREWAEQLIQEAPHLWIPSTGGGARGSAANNGSRLSQEVLEGLSPVEKVKAMRGQLSKAL